MTRKHKHKIHEALLPLAVEIDSVIPDPQNARIHPELNLKAIKNSLDNYGQRKPIVCRLEDRVIEAGNGMWQEAKELGWTHIAAVFCQDDPDMATGFALMDNQSNMLSHWDLPVLKDQLERLDTGAFEMEVITGFSHAELEMLMTQFNPGSGGGDNSRLDKKKQVKCPECGHEFTP